MRVNLWSCAAGLAVVALFCSAVQADIYSDLGAIHNTGLAPTGISGTVIGGNEGTGYQTTPLDGLADYSFSIPATSPATAGDTRDFEWIHETSAGGAAAGTKWTFGGASNSQFLLFPSIDHGPIPDEGLETTLYGSSDGGSTWILGTLVEVYDKGFNAVSLDDDYASRWAFPSAVSMISATAGLTQGAYSFASTDTEIDTVQMVPAPGAAILAMMGLSGIGWVRRRIG